MTTITYPRSLSDDQVVTKVGKRTVADVELVSFRIEDTYSGEVEVHYLTPDGSMIEPVTGDSSRWIALPGCKFFRTLKSAVEHTP